MINRLPLYDVIGCVCFKRNSDIAVGHVLLTKQIVHHSLICVAKVGGGGRPHFSIFQVVKANSTRRHIFIVIF